MKRTCCQVSFDTARSMLLSRFGPRGLRLVHQGPVDMKAFGNTFADFEATGIELRLMKDRGQLLLSMAAPQDQDRSRWYPVDSLFEFLGILPVVNRNEPIDVGEIANVLEGEWERVVELLNDWPSRKPEVDSYLRERFEARLRSKP